MRAFVPALALVAGVLVSSPSQAFERLPPPKLVLADVVGFGTTGNTGWFGYTRYGSHLNADVQPGYSRLEQRSKASQLTVAPRIEILFGEYFSLGAELTYARTSFASDAFSGAVVLSQATATDRLTLVPIVGGRVPLPRGLSLWAHAGFGGGAAVTSSPASIPADGYVADAAQLVTRLRADVRLGFEPVRGVMFTVGPELQRTAFGNHRILGSSSSLTVGVWAGLSFVIR